MQKEINIGKHICIGFGWGKDYDGTWDIVPRAQISWREKDKIIAIGIGFLLGYAGFRIGKNA